MKVVSVGDISVQVRGVTYSKSESSEEPRPGLVAILRANNITDGGLSFDDLVFVPVARVSPKQRIHANDVVIAASSGSLSVVGKAAQARQGMDGSFGAFCKVLRPSDEVHPLYFGHFFRTPVYRRTVSGLAAGANINNLKNEHLDNLQIPLPPLPVQKRIAAILDAADALRAKRRESIEQLDSLVQATFLEMFGDPVTNPKQWEVTSLQNLCVTIFDIDHKMPKAVETGIPFISAKDLADDGSISFANVKQISAEDFNRLARKGKPGRGDIVYSRIGARLGKARLVEVDFDFLASYSCCTIKAKRGVIDRHFLCYLLDSPFTLRQALSGIRAIAVPDLGLGMIKAFKIVTPPLALQTRFASIVESIEQQRARLKAHLAELDTLFASLQSRAFNGELVA